MLTIPIDQLHQTIALLGSDGITEDEVEAGVAAFAQDPMTARRLIDWIPEAFGLVLVSHLGKILPPKTFGAKASDGKWVEFDLKAEPIFIDTLSLAIEVYHSGPRSTFSNIALRSSMLGAVNEALNAGVSIDGAVLSGPALIGIPAEVYGYRTKP
jgi:hypothetical protein